MSSFNAHTTVSLVVDQRIRRRRTGRLIRTEGSKTSIQGESLEGVENSDRDLYYCRHIMKSHSKSFNNAHRFCIMAMVMTVF